MDLGLLLLIVVVGAAVAFALQGGRHSWRRGPDDTTMSVHIQNAGQRRVGGGGGGSSGD